MKQMMNYTNRIALCFAIIHMVISEYLDNEPITTMRQKLQVVTANLLAMATGTGLLVGVHIAYNQLLQYRCCSKPLHTMLIDRLWTLCSKPVEFVAPASDLRGAAGVVHWRSDIRMRTVPSGHALEYETSPLRYINCTTALRTPHVQLRYDRRGGSIESAPRSVEDELLNLIVATADSFLGSQNSFTPNTDDGDDLCRGLMVAQAYAIEQASPLEISGNITASKALP